MVRVHRERIGVLREAMGRAPGDPELGGQLERVVSHICDKLAALLLARSDEIGHPDPVLAAHFAFRLLLGVLKSDAVRHAGHPRHPALRRASDRGADTGLPRLPRCPLRLTWISVGFIPQGDQR